MASKIPIGISDFAEIREGGYVYIDKTEQVYDMANRSYNVLLLRPHGFGKSLLISTLKYYFQGRKELFEGLTIELLEKKWKKRPVIHIDMSDIKCDNVKELEESIAGKLRKYEKLYGLGDFLNRYHSFMHFFVDKIAETTGVKPVVLIDDYDKPALNHAADEEKCHEILHGIERFCNSIKGSKFHFMLITGTTRFPESPLISGLNLSIATERPKYASICGITEEEMLRDLGERVQSMADANGWTKEKCIDELRRNYGGYRFSYKSPEIYNPVSLLQALVNSKLGAYWTANIPSYITELIKKYGITYENIKTHHAFKSLWFHNNQSLYSLKDIRSFLSLEGYLTIKGCEGEDFDRMYTIGIPNDEVKDTFFDVALPYVVGKDKNDVKRAIGRMQDALMADDIPELFENLKQLVSETPYITGIGDKNKLYERDFRFILRCALYLCGCRIEEEKQTSKGRIDIVAHYKDIIMLLELKLDNNGGLEAAKQQIIDNNYVSAFSAKNKKIYCVAISFNTESRSISGYEIIYKK